MKQSIVYAVDFVLLVGSLGFLLYLVGPAQPLVIAPLDKFETTETELLFVVKNAQKLLIDNNLEFTSPREYEISEDLRIDLGPGTYYWNAVGIRSSEVRTFTILSEVNLKFKKLGKEGYGVVNAGNVDLNVDVYADDVLVDKLDLQVQEVQEVTGDLLIGGQK